MTMRKFFFLARNCSHCFLGLLACVALVGFGCSAGGDKPVAQKVVDGESTAQKVVTQKTNTVPPELLGQVQLPPGMSQYEGSVTKNQRQMQAAESLVEGYGDKPENHPNVQGKQKVQRTISVPGDVRGKWKAVKLLIKNKADEEQNQIRTIDLGSSLILGDSGIKVTVGPFLPNFVMTGTSYTSMTNQLDNPAVQLVVEEKGKEIYKGWAFAKFPTMYAFPHERYSIELMDFIPEQVS